MQKYVLKIKPNNDCSELYQEIMQNVSDDDSDFEVYTQLRGPYRGPMAGLPEIKEILVILGSVGAFSALWKVVRSYLERNKNHEVMIEREGFKIHVKGHDIPGEDALLARLLPNTTQSQDAKGEETRDAKPNN